MGVQGISQVFSQVIQYWSLGVSWGNHYESLFNRLWGIRYLHIDALLRGVGSNFQKGEERLKHFNLLEKFRKIEA